MEDTVLYRDPLEVFSPLESDKVSNVSSLSAFLATLNQSGSGNTRIRRFLDETGSLDVNIGDSNSCRLSDISSISYTNVTQDDNESLGCETNASLDNVIDSASSCRSDEESPYELDHDEADYGLDSSGYFGNRDLFPERPTKVDKSSMTNLAPSDDDVKNFMSITDSHDRNSGFSVEIKRDSIKPQKSIDESPGAEIKELIISPKAEKPSNKNFGDNSNLDCSRSPSFLHASSDESISEVKDIFVNKDFNSKVELKLNGMIGTKSAISNCKGSKVMLEFYCGKNVDRERINDKLSSDMRDELKVHKNTSRNGCSDFDMFENNIGHKDFIDLSKPENESESTLDMPLAKPQSVITKSQDEVKKVRIPSRIRPSPGLAKRIEESTSQDTKPPTKFTPASTNDGLLTTDKRLLVLAKNDETNSQSADSSEPKTQEKKSCPAKALDFCNEDIESSLNEIRSILYGSRIGLAKSSSHSTNLNQSINIHAVTKRLTSSNNLIDSSIQLTDKDSCTNNVKHSGSCEVLKDLSDGKVFIAEEKEEEFAKPKNNPSDGQPVKAEMSVIDELLEELRMSEPSYIEDQDIPQINSPSVEMKNDFKYKLIDNHSERTYIVNLSVPYAMEKKTFSLSPEATDCDSIDASSIISDEGKTSPSAMPVVEDGLSSEDEGRDGLNEFSRGSKARKSYVTSSRAEQIPRVLKHEDKFFQASSSGSVSNVSISSSHSKQNGFSVKMKLPEKQAPKKDIKSKVKENSSEPLHAHLDNVNVQVDIKVKSERPDLFGFLVSVQKPKEIQMVRTS